VTDYLLEIELRRLKKRHQSNPLTNIEEDSECANRIEAVSRDAPVATLVVMLHGEAGERPLLPGFLKTPQLWPESNDPEVIVDEVLATCRGIESI
jgi:hypothetical protein